ncbi:MAG: DNA cytosine methyltransferase [Bellilinea sp.]
MKSMHLFAGGGGGLLADLILGHEPIIAVEWDKYACAILRERAAEWFPNLQVYEGDIRMFDSSEYAGRVDCIHAGFPCQDISVAGAGAGLGEGTRSGLYREVLRIAGVVRPKIIFLENVSAILNRGLETVLGDLAALGYDAKWCCLRASDVGANHGRDRWWLLAKLGNTESQFSNGINHNAGVSVEHGQIPELRDSSGEADVGNPEHDGQSATEVARSIAPGGNHSQTGENPTSELARPGEQQGYVANATGRESRQPSERQGREDIGGRSNEVGDVPNTISNRPQGGGA